SCPTTVTARRSTPPSPPTRTVRTRWIRSTSSCPGSGGSASGSARTRPTSASSSSAFQGDPHGAPATPSPPRGRGSRRLLEQLAPAGADDAHPRAAARPDGLPELPSRPVLGVGGKHARLLHQGSGLPGDERAGTAGDGWRAGELLRPVPRAGRAGG